MLRRGWIPTLVVALMLVAGLGGVAIAAQDTPTGDPNLSATVTYWTAYNTVSPEFEALTEEVIPAFNELYPNVTIDAQALPYDELRQKLLTAIAGGQTPDLLRADIIWVPEFAELGALVALDELMPDFATLAEQFYPGPLATNLFQGHYYGLPLDTNTRVLVYNQALLDQAEVTAPPATFEEFAAACGQFAAAGVTCFAEGGTGAWNVLPWIWSNGGAVTDPEYTTATGYLNSAASVVAVQLLADMLEAGTLSESILGGGIATSEAIGTDQVGMIVDGPWMPPIFDAQFPDLQEGYAPFPAGPGGSISVVGGEDIVLFEQSENKDAALAFMRFVVSEQAQIAMGKTGQMPVVQSLTDNPELPEYFAVFQQQLETAQPRTPSPAWPKIDEAINTAVQQVLRGEKDAQAAMDEAAATVDELLAEYLQ
jgi:multiple sugar transport system substrate-binding protein